MTRKLLVLFAIVSGPMFLLGQSDSVRTGILPEVTVSDSRSDYFSTGNRTDVPDSNLRDLNLSGSVATLLDASGGSAIRSYAPGNLTTLSLRGGNSQQTAISWHGISLNNPAIGLNDLNLFPTFLFDRIAMVPGLPGSIMGSASIGGTLVLDNRPPVSSTPVLTLMQGFGSFKQLTTGLNVSYRLSKWKFCSKAFYQSAANHYPYKNYTLSGSPEQTMQNAGIKNLHWMQEIVYPFKRGGDLYLSYWGFYAQRLIPGTLLSGISEASQADHGHRLFAGIQQPFQRSKARFGMMYQDDHILYDQGQGKEASLLRSEVITGESEIQARQKHWLNLRAGVQINYSRVSNTGYEEPATRNQQALWLCNELKTTWQQARIQVNARQEFADGLRLPFLPSISFRTRPNAYLTVYGTSGRVYRLPTLNDLYWYPGGNRQLKPESGWNHELSAGLTRSHRPGSTWQITVTGFTKNLSNYIQWKPLDAVIWTPVNLSKVNTRGIETRLSFERLFSHTGFNIKLNYDFIRAASLGKDDPEKGLQLPYVPVNKLTGIITFQFKQTRFMVNGIWVDRRYTTSDHSGSLPDYTLINLACYQTLKWTRFNSDVYVKINNLFNQTYEMIPFRPVPGINYECGVIFKVNP